MKRIMVSAAALLLALTVTGGAGAQQKPARAPAPPKVPVGTTQQFQGVSYIIDGKALPAAEAKAARLSEDGHNFTFEIPGRVATKGTFTLDASKMPKQIDLTLTSGPGRGGSLKGIFELKGETLRLCYAAPGKARPSDFSSRPGSGNSLLVLHHVKVGPNAKGPLIPLDSKSAAPKSSKLVVPPGGVKGVRSQKLDVQPDNVSLALFQLKNGADLAAAMATKAQDAAAATTQALGGPDGSGPVDLAQAQASVQTAQQAAATAQDAASKAPDFFFKVKGFGGAPSQVNQATAYVKATQASAQAAQQAADSAQAALQDAQGQGGDQTSGTTGQQKRRVPQKQKRN
jgi:uncharacterized protein (TIGR03067 family)